MSEESLPTIISRAGARLLEAKNSAELLEARAIAEAALHYARVTRAANDTHADCLRIITRAEIRMANELDAARVGEVHGVDLPTYEELGIERQRVHDWRNLRDAGEGVVETVLRSALEEGRRPTKSEILKAASEIRREKQGEKATRRAEKERRLADKIASLPDQRFGVIYADPPWKFAVRSELGMDRSADNHYPCQETEEIADLDIPGVCADDCVLFLWATVPMLRDALAVMHAWGFEYKSQLAWVKDRVGTGYWFRNQHELLLVGTIGKIPAPAMGSQWASVLSAPVGRHSAKPDAIYELIESYYPSLPKLEMYARSPRAGWSVCGLEADGVDDDQ